MSQEVPQKKSKGCMIAGIIVALIAILGLMMLALITVLSLIAAPTLLNASEKARIGAVKANTSAAASTVTTYLFVDNLPAKQAIKKSITQLNTAGTPDDTSDDAYSPFDSSLPAFDTTPGPGVVVLEAKNDKTVLIIGYDKKEHPVAQKIVSTAEGKEAIKNATEGVEEQ